MSQRGLDRTVSHVSSGRAIIYSESDTDLNPTAGTLQAWVWNLGLTDRA